MASVSLLGRSRALPSAATSLFASASLKPTLRLQGLAALSLSRSLTTVLVDGSGSFEAPLRRIQSAVAKDGTQPVDVLTVGQRGIAQAMVAAAQLESSSTKAKPTFIIQQTNDEEAKPHLPKDFKLTGKERYFKISFPPASEWKLEGTPESRAKTTTSEGSSQAKPDKLIVGNKTEVMKLAKAVMARSFPLEPGMSISVETAIKGQAKMLNLRLQHLAQTASRAHHWQVSPVDRSRSVRTFRCAASVRKAAEGDPEPSHPSDPSAPRPFEALKGYSFLILEVLPDGPVGGVIL
eukprot:CAMPEP_0206573262 /NCGR_PEP_ID=MMETSP0325_2-20121206/28741_1 /ASSEMBLY_ACC=CAM_ASM_000347 /TAXON_ID=2866 /ORGANISM="Crypthecodinium cohnii, Strain Seligo" /LENGTH=292 /DNA_ID=CAMNT_0054077633 /DNA_START=91 /DNA_END=966 /DNA_ORIENTATION=+